MLHSGLRIRFESHVQLKSSMDVLIQSLKNKETQEDFEESADYAFLQRSIFTSSGSIIWAYLTPLTQAGINCRVSDIGLELTVEGRVLEVPSFVEAWNGTGYYKASELRGLENVH